MPGEMGVRMMVIGRTIKCKGKAFINGQMAVYIMETIKMTRNTGTVLKPFRMVQFIKGSMSTDSNMVKVYLSMKMVQNRKELGKMEYLRNGLKRVGFIEFQYLN